jgi:hypothetical protein
MKPLLVHTRRFPPRAYSAITLFPFVFYNGDTLPERSQRHETIHLYQQLALLVVPFYVLYLIFWLIGLLRYGNHDRAYRSIPFERSAYRLETRTDLSWSIMAFDWLRCLKG